MKSCIFLETRLRGMRSWGNRARLDCLRLELFAHVHGQLCEILDFDETSRDENFAQLQPTHRHHPSDDAAHAA